MKRRSQFENQSKQAAGGTADNSGLYAPFMHNREISLGALDFMAFTSDDVLELLEEFYDSFMRQLASNENMKSVLRSAAPLPSAAPFL